MFVVVPRDFESEYTFDVPDDMDIHSSFEDAVRAGCRDDECIITFDELLHHIGASIKRDA